MPERVSTCRRRIASRTPGRCDRGRDNRSPCACGEARFEGGAHFAAVQLADLPHGLDCLGPSLSTMKPDQAVIDDFGHRAVSGRRSPACRRPSPRSSPGRTAPASRSGTAAPWRCRGSRLSLLADFADEFHIRLIHHRGDHRVPIMLVGAVHLGGHFQFHPRRRRRFDGAVGALFGRNPAEEGEIVMRRGLREQQVFRQAVIAPCRPISPAGIGRR